MCRPKAVGGLGLRKTEHVNKAFMVKATWNLCNLRNSLWWIPWEKNTSFVIRGCHPLIKTNLARIFGKVFSTIGTSFESISDGDWGMGIPLDSGRPLATKFGDLEKFAFPKYKSRKKSQRICEHYWKLGPQKYFAPVTWLCPQSNIVIVHSYYPWWRRRDVLGP